MTDTLATLQAKFPIGSKVRYWDTRVCGHRSRRVRVTGTVLLVRRASNGRNMVRVALPDSTLDTLPENLRPARDGDRNRKAGSEPFPDPELP